MQNSRLSRPLLVTSGLALMLGSAGLHAQQAPARAGTQQAPARPNTQQRIDNLQRQLDEQRQEIERLRSLVSQQQSNQDALQQRLQQEQNAARATARVVESQPGAVTAAAGASPPVAVRVDPHEGQGQRVVQVGVAPAAPEAPPVVPMFDQPGILTPPGRYVLEPSVQYGYSSSNRVALVGYTIIPALLIGLVDVREVKRNTITAALTGRWGLTNRLEAELRVPYVYRNDASISREIFTGAAAEQSFSSRGHAVGDVEMAVRYQLNQPRADRPYLIGSLRFKSRTGKDPFDVVTDCQTRCIGNTTGTGLPLDLPTGSGFYSLQPSLTWLMASDPAVFFGGISYTYNFGRDDISRQVLNGQREYIGSIKPGNIWGLNFGMGMALNDRSSFSMGLDLSSIGRTKQNGSSVASSVRAQIATLQLGYSYRLSQRTTLNVSVGAGLTRDTPDLTLTVRLPMSF